MLASFASDATAETVPTATAPTEKRSGAQWSCYRCGHREDSSVTVRARVGTGRPAHPRGSSNIGSATGSTKTSASCMFARVDHRNTRRRGHRHANSSGVSYLSNQRPNRPLCRNDSGPLSMAKFAVPLMARKVPAIRCNSDVPRAAAAWDSGTCGDGAKLEVNVLPVVVVQNVHIVDEKLQRVCRTAPSIAAPSTPGEYTHCEHLAEGRRRASRPPTAQREEQLAVSSATGVSRWSNACSIACARAMSRPMDQALVRV